MALWLGIPLFLATVRGMEAVACAICRGVTHGPGRFLHASRHCPRDRFRGCGDLHAAASATLKAALARRRAAHEQPAPAA
ncbi:hypothetical protein [Hephaestia caeni]|uniref:hypothetical protein n=1 Tax=Hephaestia caeni TaxID=645617 RepID=UPI0011C3B503|nr:hypothetical protein [Hephaestia caeni]